MTRSRLTIAELMALVLFLGFGFAALRGASAFWASATFTVAVVAISTAVVGAIVRRGRARAAWAGFAALGWSCLLVGMVPIQTLGTNSRPPRLLMNWGLHALLPFFEPAAQGGAPYIAYDQISHALEIILFGIVGAILGRLVSTSEG